MPCGLFSTVIIASLKKKYQGTIDEDGKYHEGAATLISRAKSETTVLKRKGSPIINPDTGECHNVSSFTFDIAAPINADDYTIAPFASFFPTEYLDANYASLFNSDYTCMVATKTFLGNEEQHA